MTRDSENTGSDQKDGAPVISDTQNGVVVISMPKSTLEAAIVDALRLDYDGRLAKLCEAAIDDCAMELSDYLSGIITSVIGDQEFADSLREMIKKRIRERVSTKVDAAVKKAKIEALER